MYVHFLEHSGFCVELPTVTLLFDWWKGALPPVRPEVPLLVFVSHRHEDHFNPDIFSLPAAAFVLGKGIKPSVLARRGLSQTTLERCVFPEKGVSFELTPRVCIEVLPSTDEGAAFLVTVDKQTVFHAGDLNWWHWEGEDKAWNRNMEVNFKRYTEPLRDRHIDLAMLPLDPRLGEDGFLGPRYFLELADIRCFLPMHQWGDYAFTNRFLARYPEYARQTLPVTRSGEQFEIGEI